MSKTIDYLLLAYHVLSYLYLIFIFYLGSMIILLLIFGLRIGISQMNGFFIFGYFEIL